MGQRELYVLFIYHEPSSAEQPQNLYNPSSSASASALDIRRERKVRGITSRIATTGITREPSDQLSHTKPSLDLSPSIIGLGNIGNIPPLASLSSLANSKATGNHKSNQQVYNQLHRKKLINAITINPSEKARATTSTLLPSIIREMSITSNSSTRLTIAGDQTHSHQVPHQTASNHSSNPFITKAIAN